MSRTPIEAGEPEEDYRLGWLAINKLLNQGFSWSGHERNCAFLNARGGAFADVSSVTGFDFDDDGRSVASVDWDHDGDLDFFVTNRTGPRLRFLRSALDGGGGGHLQLFLEGTACNRDAIGARVEVALQDPGAAPLLRTRRAGDGYQAQSSGWLHFGLGGAAVRQVAVSWPGGEREVFAGVEAGGRYRLVQGSGLARAWSPPDATPSLAPSAPAPPRARSAARVVLATPVPMPRIEVESADGRGGSLFGVEARAGSGDREQMPLLLQLWASWCAPCTGELTAFAAAAEDLRAAGIEVLALNVEEETASDAARERLRGIGWPHPSGFARADTLEILDALQGAILRQEIRIPVPSSFLVDGHGNLVAFYLGRVEPEQVVADLRLPALDAAQRLRAALPFAGRWHGPPPVRSPAFLERAFRERGLPGTAREYQPGWIHLQWGRAFLARSRWRQAEEQFRAAIAAGPYLAEAHLGLGRALRGQGRTEEAVDELVLAVQRNPESEAARFELGLARLVLRDHDAVREQIESLRALGSRYAAELETRLDAAEGG